MRQVLPLALLIAAAAMLLALPREAAGCAVADRDGNRTDIAEESALIVWDEANKTEHFIRRASFQSTGYDLGFLVPTPHRPQLAEAEKTLFDTLGRFTMPRVEVVHKTAVPSCGFGAAKMASGDASPAGVLLLESGKVGDLDYQMLGFRPGSKDDDPAAGAGELAKWLALNGYSFAPTLADWLKPYVRDGWIVTAFKVAAKPPAAGGDGLATGRGPRGITTARSADNGRDRRNGLQSSTVRMTFKADRPFYPYREPAEQRDAHAQLVLRTLRVFFVGSQRFAGTLGDGSSGAWPGRTVWANQISASEAHQVAVGAKLPEGKLPAGEAWLTEFEDRSTPRPGTDEVYFAPSADQTTVARPPTVHVLYDDTPWRIGLAICFALPVLVTGVVVARWAVRRPV